MLTDQTLTELHDKQEELLKLIVNTEKVLKELRITINQTEEQLLFLKSRHESIKTFLRTYI